MAEEKKEEKIKVKEEMKTEAPKTETPKAEKPQVSPQAPQAKAAEAPAKTPEAPKKTEVKKEKPANCAACNKSIKHKQWYYRNEKFYCSKRCFKSTLKKAENPEEGPKEAA
ncbi:MAG: hypothetical protein WC592_03480 [Candidatus Omnitrophota bacterium]|nr:hypothetical protein [Candidatus Omnitrophota bacterium]